MGKVACISIRKTTGEFSRRVVFSFSPFSSQYFYNVALRKSERRLSDAAEKRTTQRHTREEQQKVIVVKRKEKEQEKGEKRVKPASLLECLAKRSEISECSQHRRAYARQIGPKSSFHLAPEKNALLNIRASRKKKEKRVKASHFAIERHRRRWSWWWRERKEEEKRRRKRSWRVKRWNVVLRSNLNRSYWDGILISLKHSSYGSLYWVMLCTHYTTSIHLTQFHRSPSSEWARRREWNQQRNDNNKRWSNDCQEKVFLNLLDGFFSEVQQKNLTHSNLTCLVLAKYHTQKRARETKKWENHVRFFFCFKFNELLAVRLWLSRWVCELPKTRLTSAWLYVRLDLKNGIGIFSEMIKETERSYRTQRADGIGFQRKFNRIALALMTKWKNFLRYRQASDDVSVQRKKSLVMNGLCAERFGRIPTTFSFALRDTSATHQRWVSETRH